MGVNVSGNASPYSIPAQHAQKQQNKNNQNHKSKQKATTKANNSDKNGNHARNASLSISYIQQQQQHFFMEQPMPSDSNSDDDIYEDMIKDGLGANNNNQHSQQQNKQKKQKHNKSREETEDVWCCAVCTYQNNMLLGYCELCGCKKPDKPSIVKRVVYSENNAQNEDNSSPSPPSPQPQSTDINVLDVTQGNDSSQIQFENMLPINDNQSNEENASKHHQQIPNLLHIPKRNGLHRHTQSESNVLMTKQRAAKYWACSVCTFNENPIDYPVCKMCSALPPERPPSASSDNLPQNKKKEKTKQNKAVSKHILDESIDEMDPLGHQRSTSVTKVSIMDESTVHNNQQSNNQKAQ